MAGTKPQALHTEYAKEDASFDGGFFNPGNDIVFYLMRADQGGNDGESMETGELNTTDDAMLHAMANGGLDGFPGGTEDDALLYAQANGSLDDFGR